MTAWRRRHVCDWQTDHVWMREPCRGGGDGGLHDPSAGDQDHELAEVGNRITSAAHSPPARGGGGHVGVCHLLRYEIREVKLGVVGEVLERDGVPSCEWVVAGDRNDARFVADDRPDDQRPVVERQPRDHQIHVPAEQRRNSVL
jgi:hypothetical protein